MKKKNNINENIKRLPYSNKFLADELKSCLTPLLRKKEIVEKWSPEIPQYIEQCADHGINYYDNDIEDIEYFLFYDVNTNTYINMFKTIYNSVAKLIGKLLIEHYVSNELILNIKDNIDNMYNIRWELDSWLIREAEHYHSEDFAELCNIITDVRKNFNSIYTNYNQMNIDSDNIPYYLQQSIEKIKSIYEKILRLAKTIFALQDDDRMYLYKNTLKTFAQNLVDELMYIMGEIYLDVENDLDIYLRGKEKIEKYFKRLEKTSINGGQKLEYIFYDLNKNCNHGSTTDNALLYAYQELKGATYTMIISNWG